MENWRSWLKNFLVLAPVGLALLFAIGGEYIESALCYIIAQLEDLTQTEE